MTLAPRLYEYHREGCPARVSGNTATCHCHTLRCPDCKGYGYTDACNPLICCDAVTRCDTCNGTGRITR